MKGKRKHPMEILWICMFVICMLLALLVTFNTGFKEAAPMYGCSGVCVLMYLWRHTLRKNEENKDNKKMQ